MEILSMPVVVAMNCFPVRAGLKGTRKRLRLEFVVLAILLESVSNDCLCDDYSCVRDKKQLTDSQSSQSSWYEQ